MFSAFADVVANLKPRAFIVENVRGLTRASFANYLAYIEHRMSMPEMFQKPGETWREHLRRLEREKTSVGRGLRYNLARQLFNAADCGAPQRRERVFIVGFRSDQDVHWSFPDPTHSQDALLHAQLGFRRVLGPAPDLEESARRGPGEIGPQGRGLARTQRHGRPPAVADRRDALRGLPEPRADGRETGGF